MPLLRGKQYELRLLEVAGPLIQGASVVPIVEPVSVDTTMLERVIQFYIHYKFPLGVVLNPGVGKFSHSSKQLQMCIGDLLCRTPWVFPVFRTSAGDIDWNQLKEFERFALIDNGLQCDEIRSELLGDVSRITYRISEIEVGKERQERLADSRIVLHDGFERRRNVDYPKDEEFRSGPGRLDLKDASGWGDYLIVGQQFQAGGGRPHAVAIHITYWASEGGLRVHHYLSDSNDGPENPAGKFAEALEKLITDLDRGTYPVLGTSAIRKLRELHERAHFPGLGYLKLLAMWHHLETVCHHLDKLEERPEREIVHCE